MFLFVESAIYNYQSYFSISLCDHHNLIIELSCSYLVIWAVKHLYPVDNV